MFSNEMSRWLLGKRNFFFLFLNHFDVGELLRGNELFETNIPIENLVHMKNGSWTGVFKYAFRNSAVAFKCRSLSIFHPCHREDNQIESKALLALTVCTAGHLSTSPLIKRRCCLTRLAVIFSETTIFY